MELTQNQGVDHLADAVWDERSFADVLTDSVKVEVESVYTTLNNGFKEIQFYHNNCITGLFVVWTINVYLLACSRLLVSTNRREKNRELKSRNLGEGGMYFNCDLGRVSNLSRGNVDAGDPGVVAYLSSVCLYVFSKIQLVVYYQCCVLIGWATTRLYVIAY